MKRKSTEEILMESFLELAEKNSVEKISTKEIANNCGYSTATFYRHYSDKYDLIARCYTEQMGEIMKGFDKDDFSWEDAYFASTEYYLDNRQYLANLFRHTSGLDSFVRNMTEINCRVYEQYLQNHFPNWRLDEKTKMKIRLFCHGASRLVSEWILDNNPISSKEMAEILMESFPIELP